MVFMKNNGIHRLVNAIKKVAWFCIAAVALMICKLSIMLLPFKQVVKWYGGTEMSVEDLTLKQLARARRLRYVIEKCAHACPWRCVCYEQALAAMMMARLLGIPMVMHYGIKRDGAMGMKAHAWTLCGDVTVTGELEMPEFYSVYSIVHTPKKIRQEG